jgi:hypothetical protein
MSRVGFKKSFAAGMMDDVTMYEELYLPLKDHLGQAGFVTVLDDQTEPGWEEYFHFIQAGAPVTAMQDDTPRWMISFDANGPVLCSAHASYGDMVATLDVVMASSDWGMDEDTEIWFAADGAAGWWWLAQFHSDATPSGFTLDALIVATPSRRYLADQQTGLCARYGLVQIDATLRRWLVPYAMGADGVSRSLGTVPTDPNFGSPAFDLFSPLGGSTLRAARHTGSPLATVAAPIFPVHPALPQLSAAMLGELEAILQITDGYATGATVVPGWVALTTGDPATVPALALPAPDIFTILP